MGTQSAQKSSLIKKELAFDSKAWLSVQKSTGEEERQEKIKERKLIPHAGQTQDGESPKDVEL